MSKFNPIQSVRGMPEWYGKDCEKFMFIIDSARVIAKNFNYQGIIMPVVEFASTFERNLGEESDIVSKELYKFTDKGGNVVALRPEFTAGIVRFIIENSIHKKQPLPYKLFTSGPLFRYDRPQKGRYRQLNQINFENIGGCGFEYDFEVILIANELLKYLNICDYKLHINYIVSDERLEKYKQDLTEFLLKNKEKISQDSVKKIESGNVLRILDSKSPQDIAIIELAPKIIDYTNQEENKYIKNVFDLLQIFEIKYTVDNSLIRGMDYYTGIVFEFVAQTDSSQSALIGGGRYDKLIRTMSDGKVDLPCVGFAGGVERLLMAIDEKKVPNKFLIGIIYYSDNEKIFAIKTAQNLRQQNIQVEVIFSDNKIGKKFDIAAKINCDLVIVCGEDELEDGFFTVKNMKTGHSEKITQDRLVDYVNCSLK